MRRFICMFLIVFLGAVLISGCQSSSDDRVEEVDSPEYLAFSSGESYQGDIFIMNEEGTVQKRLTDNSYDDYRPAWSPDGSSIAFISDRSGNGDAI
ncbi:MAG: TolB family protein, partial [Halanaerobiales bacterium]